MENASKALLMAAGVLIAVMLLSLIVYMSTSMTRIAGAQDQRTEAEQLAAFNKEYEAYNKQKMYGTDIITVVNKAINHNYNMQTSNVDDPYYINISITPTQTFETIYEKIDTTEVYPVAEITEYSGLSPEARSEFGAVNTNTCFEAGVTETLGKWQQNSEEFVMDNYNFIKFFSANKEDNEISPPESGDEYRYIMYSALTNFKRAIFKCYQVDYNDITGRIEAMHFEQTR